MKRKVQQSTPAKKSKIDVTDTVQKAVEQFGRQQQEHREVLFRNSMALRLNEKSSVTCIQDVTFKDVMSQNVFILNEDTIAITVEHDESLTIVLYCLKTMQYIQTGIVETEIDIITQYGEDCILYVSGSPCASSIRIFNLNTRSEIHYIALPNRYIGKIILANDNLILVACARSLLIFEITEAIKQVFLSTKISCIEKSEVLVLSNGTICATDFTCGASFLELPSGTRTVIDAEFEFSYELPLLTMINNHEVLAVREEDCRNDLFCVFDTINKECVKTFRLTEFGMKNEIQKVLPIREGVVAFACGDNNISIVDVHEQLVLSSSKVDSRGTYVRDMKRIDVDTILTVTNHGFRMYKLLMTSKQQKSLLKHLLEEKWCDMIIMHKK
jgi:hypothetical protein